jgi:isopenicillin N synthase-like dioxygenase
MTVETIELSAFTSGSQQERRAVASRVDDICTDVGFLTVSGHGVDNTLMTEALDVCQEFFDLPLDAKLRATDPVKSNNRGYNGVGTEALAYSLGEQHISAPDLFEAFNVGRSDTRGEYFDTYRPFFAPNIWPESPALFRPIIERYLAELHRVTDSLLELFEMALGLDTGHLIDRTRHAVITARAINYQRRQGELPPADGQLRMGAHTDYGVLTVLLADNVPGLQIFRDGHWAEVPIVEGTFVVNLGDMLARWTNDRWVSTLHRVVPPPASEDGGFRRRSIAQFVEADPGCVLECFPSCLAPGQVAKYPPVPAGEYLLSKLMGPRELRTSDQI